MFACQLNNLSPSDNDVSWVYANHGFICTTAVIKERVLVSFTNQVDDSFAFWSMQDIPKVKKFKLNGDCERELSSIAVTLQLLSKKFSSKLDVQQSNLMNQFVAFALALILDSFVLILTSSWEAVRILNGDAVTYDGTMKNTCANFIRRYAMRRGMQVRFKLCSSNEIVNSLKECDFKKFKQQTATLNATKVSGRDEFFSFL